MSGFLRHFTTFLIVCSFGSFLGGCPIDPNIDVENPAGVVLERATGAFVPGEPFTVTITISKDAGEDISALGLTEFAPDGWTFVEVNGESGQAPVVAPDEGASGELGFIWITIPEFPLTFTYTLTVPGDAGATAEISGRVDYYQDAGILSTDELVSGLTAAPV